MMGCPSLSIGSKIACNSTLVRCLNDEKLSAGSRAVWHGWPTGIVLGFGKSLTFENTSIEYYYVLANNDFVYEFEAKQCWFLEEVDLNYDELLTHPNEIVRTLIKKVVKNHA